MSGIDIRIELLRKGKTITSLAREFGCHRKQLSMCIHRTRAYPGLRELLAKELGTTVGKLFGEPRAKPRRKAA